MKKNTIATLSIFMHIIIMFIIINNSSVTSCEEVVIFAMDDYVGDDDGPGGYLYPIDSAYKDGVFDLVHFFIEDLGTKLRFIFMFYELDDNPWNGPYGFSTQFIQVYIDSIPSEGNTETWYAKVHVSSLDSWDVALLIGPGLRPEHNRIWYGGISGGTYIDNVMNIYVNRTLSAIVAEVSKIYLPNIDNLNKWRYIVLVLGIDPESPNGIISVAPGEPKLRAFGSGELHREAATRGIAPQVIDALYPDPEIQYEVLSSYSLSPPKYATIIAVPSSPLISITKTITKTYTLTYTKRELTTKTMIKTKTTTITTKLTNTITVINATTINRTKYIPYTTKTTITKITTQERTIYSTIYVTKSPLISILTKFITLTSTLTTSINKQLNIGIQNLLVIAVICLLALIIILLKKHH